MAVLSVMYPNQPGARFDETYYLERHIPLVRRVWAPMGLTEVRLLRGASTPDGGPAPFQMIALVAFRSIDALHQALAAHSEEVFASIQRYTDIQPIMQISEEAIGR